MLQKQVIIANAYRNGFSQLLFQGLDNLYTTATDIYLDSRLTLQGRLVHDCIDSESKQNSSCLPWNIFHYYVDFIC